MSNLNLARQEAAQNASNLPQEAKDVMETLNDLEKFTVRLDKILMEQLRLPSTNAQHPTSNITTNNEHSID